MYKIKTILLAIIFFSCKENTNTVHVQKNNTPVNESEPRIEIITRTEMFKSSRPFADTNNHQDDGKIDSSLFRYAKIHLGEIKDSLGYISLFPILNDRIYSIKVLNAKPQFKYLFREDVSYTCFQAHLDGLAKLGDTTYTNISIYNGNISAGIANRGKSIFPDYIATTDTNEITIEISYNPSFVYDTLCVKGLKNEIFRYNNEYYRLSNDKPSEAISICTQENKSVAKKIQIIMPKNS